MGRKVERTNGGRRRHPVRQDQEQAPRQQTEVGRGRPAIDRQNGGAQPASAAGSAPGRELAGARSRHPARDPDPRLAAVRRRRGRESRAAEMGRVHRPAEDGPDHRHPLRHRVVALRQQMGRRLGAHPDRSGEAQGRREARDLPLLRHLHDQRAAGGFRGRRRAAGLELAGRADQPRAWRAAARGHPEALLLEERQVDQEGRILGARQAGLLGSARLPQLRRSVAGTALR